ncbi:MAG: hypothetical protein LBN93_07235 [Candidatus Symbiothrix sp.]|nr:hypothetical protein [Candidatus Symbiothrix sp.]
MKFFAVIVALMVFTLSVAPQLVEQAKAEIHQTCANSGDDDGAGCCDLCCSPFHSCGTCHGFTLSTSHLVVIPLQGKSLKLISYTQPHYSAFAGDIWQPPKLSLRA